MGIMKYFWNKIKKEAEIELENIREETIKLETQLKEVKDVVEAQDTKLKEIRAKDYEYFNYYKQVFESPNQYLIFLNLEHPNIIKMIINDLVKYYEKHLGNISGTNSRTYFRTITEFTRSIRNNWYIELPGDSTFFYPLAIGFDQKISDVITINYGYFGYKDTYFKVHLQNESWTPLFGHRQSPGEFIPITKEIRIDSPIKPVLYVLGIMKRGDDH